MNKLLILAIAACCFTSCYPMPTDEDFSVVPCTNNPDLTREKASNNAMPGGSF